MLQSWTLNFSPPTPRPRSALVLCPVNCFIHLIHVVKKSVSTQSKYVCLCGRCYSLLAAIGADRSVEHHCSLVRLDVKNLNTLYSTDLSKALFITELGSSRNPAPLVSLVLMLLPLLLISCYL